MGTLADLLTVPTTASSTTVHLVPGAHQDPADFYAIVVAIILILAAIAFVRLMFRPRRPPGSRQ
jgi:hypothetical protein